jgi:dTDP-4-amino-4,6-dideoxygalactose transaminase
MGGKLLASTEAGYVIFRKQEHFHAALTLCQHTARADQPGFPARWRPCWDSLFYSYRISMPAADLLAEQVEKLDRELAIRRANVALLRQNLAESRLLSFPDYPAGCDPSYHMVTGNFDSESAGISRDTFTRAVSAEGFKVGRYVPAPIPTWPRMNWQGYDGPPAPWLRWLEQANTDYRHLRFPNCEWKVAHSVEFGLDYLRPEKRRMRSFARCVLKVEQNLDALRQWERRQANSPAARESYSPRQAGG